MNALTGRNFTRDFWRQNAAEMSIRFSSMKSMELEVNFQHSFIDILGSFGGAWGFCMGASLFTAFELLFFATHLCLLLLGELSAQLHRLKAHLAQRQT